MNALPRPEMLEPASPSTERPVGSDAAAERALASLRGRVTRSEFLASRQAVLLSTLAELLDEPDLAQALDTFACALQRRFGAERVAVSLADPDGELRFAALSQQAIVDVASAEARLLNAAMQEACELERVVSFPAHEGRLGVLEAHRTLAGRRAGTTLASVPLFHYGELVAAMLLERRDGGAFADATLELLAWTAVTVAPLIALRRDAERGASERVRRELGERLERHLGAGRPGVRLSLAVALALATLMLFVPLDRHVVADAELVPRERRLVTAPVDGFVDEVTVSAGERVERGQVLARLDRRELDLELARRDSEIASAEAEFRAALASHDRQATAVARARLERERALRALVEQRLARGELRAPIEGLIISGNPADVTGMPIARGETLFEIAPSDGYEVHLMVDERDVHDVHERQTGTLTLRAGPAETRDLVVQAVHPVAESGDGASRFRVRATLAGADGAILRPGQSGVARLDAGTASVAAKLFAPLRRALDDLRWHLPG